MTNIECPVCKSLITDNVCGKCGYARIVFPKTVPDSIIRFEQERADALRSIIKKIADDMDDAHRKAESAISRSERLDKKLEDANNRLSQISQERDTLNKEKIRLNNTIGALKKENEDIRTEDSFEATKLKDEISNLKTKIIQQDSEMKTLKSKFNNATQELAIARDEISKLSKSAKAGNVYFILDDDGEFSVIPCPDTKRFYATGPGIESCRVPEDSITVLPVMTTAKVAFSVEKSLTGGYSLTDLAGTVTSSGATKGNKMRLTQGVSLKITGNRFKLYFCINQQ